MRLNISIKKKLILGFGILVLALIMNILITYFNLSNNAEKIEDVTHTYLPSVDYLNEAFQLVNDSKLLIKNWVFIEKKSNTADKNKLANIHAKEIPAVEKQLMRVSEKWDKGDREKLEAIFNRINKELIPGHTEIMSKLNSFESYNDLAVIFEVRPMVESEGEIILLTNDILTQFEELKSKIEQDSNTATDSMMTASKRLQTMIIIFGIIFVGIAVLATIPIVTGVNTSIKKAAAVVQKLAKGDLTAQLDTTQNDEIGALMRDLDQMISNLKNIIAEIIEGANDINLSSVNMSNDANQVAQGATQQASSAEEISSSIEEMVSNIQQNTDNSKETEKKAVVAAKGINEGSQSTLQSVKAMSEIAEKINIVNDIAFQTNILALNAAVEAARAGEHGKGFAVVAAEVRKLAERSRVAADEIEGLARNGVIVSENAGNQLSQLAPEIEKTARLVQEITSASMEQNAGADQINNAIQELNRVIQQNVSYAENLANGLSSLVNKSDDLKEAVKYFRIR